MINNRKFLFAAIFAALFTTTAFANPQAVFKGASYEAIVSAAQLAFEAAAKSNLPAASVNVPQISAVTESSAINPKGFDGQQLFDYLHTRTRHENRYSYQQSKDYMYAVADASVYNGKKGIKAFYSQVFLEGSGTSSYAYPEIEDLNGDGYIDPMTNAEHLWPQSYYNKQRPMVADLHHIQPTLRMPNVKRGDKPFSKVTVNPKYQTNSGSKLGNFEFEPADEVKGKVARAMLYFMVRYHNQSIRGGNFHKYDFWESRVDTFLHWNRMSPPDAAEKRRNQLIEQHQGNRNPFIDDYTLADKIGADVFKKQ